MTMQYSSWVKEGAVSSNGTDNVAENHTILGTPNAEPVVHDEYERKPNQIGRAHV